MTTPTALQALEVYTKGTKAWFPDEKEAWLSASVVSKDISGDNVKIVFADDIEGKEIVFESTITKLDKFSNADLPPLRNPPKLEATDDLTNLSYLNEPAVLNTIRTRYLQRNIYTYSGIVLIAANPFDRVPLYEPEIIQLYSGKRRGELEPHLFAIAEDAYRCMIREGTNQTIVVSGESGAGKTVSAKFIMRYFATADDQESGKKKVKSESTATGMSAVEEQILATNPIMETFGNAKTTRNDNSSRFGKYIEIQFDEEQNIIGAKIRTYLLERSRLIFQPDNERNYHVFYQLCAGAPLSEKKEFELQEYSKFQYLNQSGTGMIPGVDDAAEFEVTQRALSTIGISVQLQWQIFRLMAALLHIGNIQITGRGDAVLSESDPALIIATRLLGIDPVDFRKWIVKKQIVTRNEKIVTNLTPTQGHVVKDSVAKYVYANLFDWLVSVVNESLSCPDEGRISNFIGVLDIYGFEHFKKNSFEQFCINYANEKLQQEFNQHVFKLEQEEYIREKIDWQFIEFSDNQPCIEMIEGKLGTDGSWCNKLYTQFATPTHKNYFKKPRFSQTAFTVVHYANDVQYESEGFLEKNRDTVPEEHLTLLQSTKFEFLKEVFDKAAAANPAPPQEPTKRMSMALKKPTLGSIFKLSLINLMDTINQTNVHYIRCIKPNEAKVAWAFEPQMVLGQLRACGVLETIRISCAGYPSRWTFEEFADRYCLLVNSQYWDPKLKPDIRKLCTLILENSIKDKDKFQVGMTKIFFRAGQLAFLEKLRADRMADCAILVQKNVRRFLTRLRYLRLRDVVIRIQCVARKRIAQAKAQHIRHERAAIVVQKYWRRHYQRQRYLRTKVFIVNFQTAIRQHFARKKFENLRKTSAAIKIQKMLRGFSARRTYKATRDHIIRIQSVVRRRNARKAMKALKAEARSVNHFKDMSYKLENKVVELTQSLTSQKEEKKELATRASQLEVQVRSWIEKYEKLEQKAKDLEAILQKPTVPRDEWNTLQSDRDSLQQQYQQSLEKIKAQDTEIARLTAELTTQKEEIAKLRSASEQVVKTIELPNVAELMKEIASLKAQLSAKINAPQPRRQPSGASPVAHAALSAPPNAGFERGISPPPFDRERNGSQESGFFLKENISTRRGRSPTGLTATRLKRRYSSAEPREINKQGPRTSIEIIKQAQQHPKNPRPTSFDNINNIIISTRGRINEEPDDDPEEEIHRILEDEDSLQDEVLEGLVKTLKIPLPSLQNPPNMKEIFFPAHMVGICITQMWKYGYIQESERLLFNVMDTVQKQCLSFTGDDAVVPCAFWLSNVHELLSLICVAERDMEQEMNLTPMATRRTFGWHDFEKLVATVKYEMQCLEDNIFHAWMKELKRRLNKIIIPAVIESQSLPGFITSDSGRFLNKLLTGSSQPAFSMDDLLNFLNKIWRAMKCYFIEASVSRQVLTELLKLIGVSSFNDLLMRRNFCSWKRAMQIQYNITRIEEWCKSHDIPEGTLQLEHLMQATKLLQLKKASLNDIEIIYDVCWMLTPTQIQKLISHYFVADYENPISPEILKAVASRVVSGDKNDILLLDAISLEDTTSPFEIPVPREVRTDKYLPSWLYKA
ncbi:P-loop containing nucleoside triphosphate hydrolase protein [Jimgerdemannia flammicorona]|uniref:P-loop containing nucleoside triphosphate hydrolase protein n=2 Tax=Jimgerdemannia flammicorona TaxID=994334 RepID=A0A433QE27_9FUNG|nr:P-loop containing nucleoside triphosphate hydrolase protein [Jimgerdemannia flammicorona]